MDIIVSISGKRISKKPKNKSAIVDFSKVSEFLHLFLIVLQPTQNS